MYSFRYARPPQQRHRESVRSERELVAFDAVVIWPTENGSSCLFGVFFNEGLYYWGGCMSLTIACLLLFPVRPKFFLKLICYINWVGLQSVQRKFFSATAAYIFTVKWTLVVLLDPFYESKVWFGCVAWITTRCIPCDSLNSCFSAFLVQWSWSFSVTMTRPASGLQNTLETRFFNSIPVQTDTSLWDSLQVSRCPGSYSTER